MSTIDVETFKSRLLEERARTLKAISYLHEENRATTEDEQHELAGGLDNHLADIATYTYDRELDSTLEGAEGEHLAHIDGALRRIDDGTYGSCENCSKPISPERLEAMPWATLCIDCKRLAERR
jgi:RNA polymerase-binding transcription factor